MRQTPNVTVSLLVSIHVLTGALRRIIKAPPITPLLLGPGINLLLSAAQRDPALSAAASTNQALTAQQRGCIGIKKERHEGRKVTLMHRTEREGCGPDEVLLLQEKDAFSVNKLKHFGIYL